MDLIAQIQPGALFFHLLATIAVLSAVGVAFAPNILYSAFALLGTLGSVAGLYLLLGADFLGIAQLLIYVGGILVLILFAVLLTNKIGEVNITNLSAHVAIGAPFALLVIALIASVVVKAPWPVSEEAFSPGTARIGDSFLREYLMPFEIASVVLLMALVGAMVIARRAAKERGKRAQKVPMPLLFNVGLYHYLVLSAVLFGLGLLTVATRRNAVAILMGVELILNAAALNFVAFSHYTHGLIAGQVVALFIIVLAAAEAAIALAIVLSIFRHFHTIDANETSTLRE